MKISEISGNFKSKKKRRLGRGISAGQGKSCGRGTKGQNARTGKGKLRPGFEGGQMPLVMRLPKKRGLGNIKARKKDWSVIKISDLNKIKDDEIDLKILASNNFIKRGQKAKLLGVGKIDRSVRIMVNAASESAVDIIKKAGGEVIII